MIEYLYMTSNLNLFLILSSILLFVSLCALFLIKRFMPLHLRYQENAVISSTSAMVIVIYGVLAGFATLYLINYSNFASDAWQREADTVANINREAQVLSDPLQKKVISALGNYVDEVLNVEWPLMNQDKPVVSRGDYYIQQLTQNLVHTNVTATMESAVIRDLMTHVSNLYDARQNRIQASYTTLATPVWVVIIIGTILTLCVSYIFGVNFNLHIFVVLAATLMTACVLFLLISLDKPFVGQFAVGPEAMQYVLQTIQHEQHQ